MKNTIFYLTALLVIFFFGTIGIKGSKSVPDNVLIYVHEEKKSYTHDPCLEMWDVLKNISHSDINDQIKMGFIKTVPYSYIYNKDFILDKRCNEEGYGTGIWKPILIIWLEDNGFINRSLERNPS
jgi:hypothetical protein